MSWDAREYTTTFETERAERQSEREALIEELDARMENFRAERCSYATALRGGDEYAAEVREALAAEAQESRLVAVASIAKILDGWRAAVTPAGNATPRVAAIGNGLFVRVGNGSRKRRAA